MSLMLIQVINVNLVMINFVRKVQKYLTIGENLKPSLSNEIKVAPAYIAGYITRRNDNQPSESETHFYHENCGNIPY